MKMKRLIVNTLVAGFLLTTGFSSAQDHSFQLKIKNTSDLDRTDSYITLDASSLAKKHPGFSLSNFMLKEGDKIIPYQIESSGKNGKLIVFVTDLKSKEVKKINVVYGNSVKPESFKSRTYAELAMKKNGKFDGKRVHGTKYENVTKVKVPAEHIDHDGLYKYEGPGWESERVGYRFYLDWRNATDIYGKKVKDMVLAGVGVTDTIADNNESFHTMQNWGMDIFKVGSSLGVGSFGMWSDGKVNMVSKTDSVTCEIIKNGPVESEIKTDYYGWSVKDKKYNVYSRLSIVAGSRLTKNSLKVTGNADNIVTGLAKYKGTTFIKGTAKKGWNYIALYGHQSLADDNLGIAVFYRMKDLAELAEDELSYIVKLKPGKGDLEYYFGAAWEKEFDGIKSEKEFRSYLENVINELNNPLVLE
jgi:hypothetical protein